MSLKNNCNEMNFTMDKLRTLLYVSLALVVFMLWQQWQLDYAKPAETGTTTSNKVAPVANNSAGIDIDVPSAPAAAVSAGNVASLPVASKGERISVQTDVYAIEIDTQGGDIRIADLRKYPVSVKTPKEKFRIINDKVGDEYILYTQSGLLGDNAPKHTSLYTSTAKQFAMRDGDKKLEVTLHWAGENGVSVEKIYTFYRGRYDIDLSYRVNNAGGAAWQGRLYRQLKRSNFTAGGRAFTSTYTGAIVSNTEKAYQKITFDDMDDANLAQDMKGGWVAMIQHYFIGAFIAEENQVDHTYTKVSNDKQYVIGMVAQPVQVAAGTQNDIKTKLFIGPKLQKEMAAVAKNLDLVVDYGWLTILSQPIYWVMTKIHGVVGNWGWSIILLTLTIKLLFYKLSETSYRSMARMRKVTPRMKALKERFGDDKAGFQQAMMKMYQEEKINPLGGCLPILIQIPVFIALYWVLLEAVELRQAPFIFWLKDLSTADPYFILPVVMGATMLLQHRLNPTPLDPTQAKIMMMLPIMFTFFFMFFPSGLVLYWVVNNILSITQQWVITKRIDEGKE